MKSMATKILTDFRKAIFCFKDKSSLARNTTRAILMLENTERPLSEGEILSMYQSGGIPKKEAFDILIFLPVAFCRQLLPKAQWKDYYLEMDKSGETKKKKFANSSKYLAIEKVTQSYFSNHGSKETVLKIAGMSAEFRTLNTLLLQNSELQVEQVEFSPTIVLKGRVHDT